MATISIEIGLYVALPLAFLVSALIYRDGKRRGMEAADMWAVGFFVAFFLLPLVGGIVVATLYLREREPPGSQPYPVPGE